VGYFEIAPRWRTASDPGGSLNNNVGSSGKRISFEGSRNRQRVLTRLPHRPQRRALLTPDVQQVWGAEQHLWVGVAALGTSFYFDAALATIGGRRWPA
jgi:hypothetical protein